MCCGNIVAVALLCCVLYAPNASNADCKLNAEQIADMKRILATKSSSGYQLLHTDDVPTGAYLYLVCNANSEDIAVCQPNGAFHIPLPLSAPCVNHYKPIIDTDMGDRQCMSLGGSIYKVRYQLSADILYTVCYNRQRVQPLYVKHLVYGFDVATPYYQRPQFSTDGVITGAQAASFRADNVYQRFQQLLGPQQTYIADKRTLTIDRGHMAASADFAHYALMAATQKYLNVMPQFNKVNRSNWKNIETWIKRRAMINFSPLAVVTGTLGVLELQHSANANMVPMYLLPNNANPIPAWMYKVVRHNGICTVFMTYNNPFRNEHSPLPPNPCSVAPCPNDLTITRNHTSGHTVCCQYLDFVYYTGPHARIC